jgi:syntaxin-binding protein 5
VEGLTEHSLTKIYSLHNVLGEWMVEAKPPTFNNESLANPLASFVLDPLSGNELFPTSEALQAALKQPDSPNNKKDPTPHCLWIATSKRSIRIAINFNGERIAKVELEPEDSLGAVFYVTRHGEYATGLNVTVLNRSRTKGARRYYRIWIGVVLQCPES